MHNSCKMERVISSAGLQKGGDWTTWRFWVILKLIYASLNTFTWIFLGENNTQQIIWMWCPPNDEQVLDVQFVVDLLQCSHTALTWRMSLQPETPFPSSNLVHKCNGSADRMSPTLSAGKTSASALYQAWQLTVARWLDRSDNLLFVPPCTPHALAISPHACPAREIGFEVSSNLLRHIVLMSEALW